MRGNAHIFSTYERELTILEPVVVEKNTKKAVKETMDIISTKMEEAQLNKLSFFMTVDATQVTNVDKLAPLVALSMHVFRNVDSFRVEFIQVKVAKELEDESFDDSDMEMVQRQLQMGGGIETYIQQDLPFVKLNNALNHKIDNFVNKMNEINDFYQSYTKEELPKQQVSRKDFNRKYNFRNYNSTLLSLYNRCFNEVQRLCSPSLSCNPSPSFQRSFVWDDDKKKRLIVSIFNEIPIGIFYVNDSHSDLGEGKGSLLWDGKQRIHAIHSFVKNEFSIPFQGENVYYRDIAALFNFKLEDTSISLMESSFKTKREVIEAYIEINENLVKHNDEDLQHAKNMLLAN